MNTPILNQVYSQVDFERELVFKFFTVFSLFENVLKTTGFCKPGHNNEAQPNWKMFARVIAGNFNPNRTNELFSATNYMLQYPVKKQVIDNGQTIFIDYNRPQNISDAEWLSILIRGVRNNLFHGGKFAYQRPRDTELIKNSLIILEEFACLHPDIQRELQSLSRRRLP